MSARKESDRSLTHIDQSGLCAYVCFTGSSALRPKERAHAKLEVRAGDILHEFVLGVPSLATRISHSVLPFDGKECRELRGYVSISASCPAPEQDAQHPDSLGHHHWNCGGHLRGGHRQSGTGSRRAAAE